MADDRPDIPQIPTESADPEMLDAIWEALGDQRLEEALELADEAVRRFPADGEAALARAAVCFEIGLIVETREEATRAKEQGVEDLRLATWYEAAAHFHLWKFDEARALLDAAVREDDDFAEGWYLLAQVHEMQGNEVGARRGFQRAMELAPDRFFRPTRIDDEQFAEAVDAARQELDDEFRDELDELALVVEDLPTREIAMVREDDEDPLPPDLLGLFVGRSRLDSSVLDVVDQPGLIFLFRRNLERICPNYDALVEEIRTTLYHELAHHLGFEEDEMADLDLE